MKRFSLPTLASVLLLAVSLAACGNSDDSSTPTPTGSAGTTGSAGSAGSAGSTGTDTVTLSSLQTTLFTPSCALSGCHSSNNPENGLDLSAGKSFDSLNQASDTGIKRVDTATPENSLVYKVLLANVPVSGGDPIDKMPNNGKVITQDKIDAVKAWITAGAKND